jgi:NAD(P)-dependent dehydrogenase (short-subunit alcohol dehydrogenase family)
MPDHSLKGRTVLVTGAARRIGRALALACARAGADIIIHHGHSEDEARQVQKEIGQVGPRGWILQADLSHPAEVSRLIEEAVAIQPLFALVNNAAIFERLTVENTALPDWERHLAINLTAPFLLSQAFARQVPGEGRGYIVNILDFRALRPGADHFPYTVSKAALAAMTRSLAQAYAPRIAVNGLALGAILPPANGTINPRIEESIPARKWGTLEDIENALLFLLTAAPYITGEIIHVDGGRHLV